MRLKQIFKHMLDVNFRQLSLPNRNGPPTDALLVYLYTMVDHQGLENMLMKPLMEDGAELVTSADALKCRLPIGYLQPTASIDEVAAQVLGGRVALLIDQQPQALMFEIRLPPSRSIGEPSVEVSVHGGRESFGELLAINLGMLHRRLRTPNFRLERWNLGDFTQTDVILTFIEGVADQDLVTRVRSRLGKLRPKAITDAEDLITALADRPHTIVPMAQVTERPDIVIRQLISGHIAILAENSPKVVVLPGSILDHLAAMDDFYDLPEYVTMIRILRFIALGIAIYLPALYVSVISFHQEAIPTVLTLSLMSQREGAPLPTTVEAFLMVTVFEILREAGIRLPRAVGPSVSIVGGLVIGEAAISAGIASPAMVLVVSATAIATFAIPSHSLANATGILRLLVLFLASLFGFYGLMIGYIGFVAYFVGLTSGRRPFFAPLMPLQPQDVAETVADIPRPPYGQGPGTDPSLSRPPGSPDGGTE